MSYLNEVHYKNVKMRLVQCNPLVVLNRRGNSKAGLPVKSSGIPVLDLNQIKYFPSILVLLSPKKCISLLPKNGAFTHLVHHCPFQEGQKINAKEPDSRLSRLGRISFLKAAMRDRLSSKIMNSSELTYHLICLERN